ncbi:T7SS effector LXG polymorphic toxin [Bacillus swezeyi]|uniref:T7SS effector LXG polymorphic toxin n=1 Tax=Bacillus swezeyi TaxID=1925020 RepID=UPI00399CA06A
MKTLDVQALHKAIDQTLEQLKQQSDEFAQVQKAAEEIASLNDALKGKGGDAIRAFYKECHTPFLQFYDTFIEEYSSALKKMKSALNSLEPNHNGFISQSFLEHELENGLNAADRTTKHLVSKTNATIAKVSHIVDLPDLNDSDFHEQNRKALKEINQTIEKLHTFDREQTSALKTAENDLETMQRYITRLEKMYTGPKIEIASYQKGSILKPDEMDALQGGQETAMGVMLDKLDKRSKLEKEVSEVSKQDNKISKLKKKLDDFNFSTASEFYEMATEIGYENLSPWQQRYFNQIEGSRNFGNAIKGSAEGLKNAVVDTAVGLWDMVVHADETIEGINFTLHHPDVTFNIIKKGIEDSYQRDVVNGDSYTQARWFSYAVGMVGTSIVGSKGVDKAAKAAKAGKVGQVAAKATKASQNVASKTIKASKEAVKKSISSFKKSLQRVASNIKGIQIHNPFEPQVEFAGMGKIPYNVLNGEKIKEKFIHFIKSINPRTRLPRTHGRWEGVPGNGKWYSDKPKVVAVTKGEPVVFKDGRPDFTPFSRGKITFEKGQLNGGRGDFTKVYEKIMKVKGFRTKTEAKDWLKEKGLTPHHLDDVTIQLVPTDLHGNVPHIGSASDLRGGY